MEFENVNEHSDLHGSGSDLLESEHYRLNVEHATTGQRFLNWLIDNLFMRLGLSYVTGYGAGAALAVLFPDFMYRAVNEPSNYTLIAIGLFVAMCNYLIYYTICEKLFKGQTLGKALTGTRAVREDGSDLTLRNAFLRTLCRLVPFEPFSAFGTPWHDDWTGTMVIKKS